MQATATKERDYVLGTHDEEVDRLGLQHRVWRGYALDAWRRAGFTTGQTLLDVGSGPGHATRDLADIVGPAGRVIAVDGSRRFLDVINRIGLPNVEAHEMDLDAAGLPWTIDGAWVRWVFAFVKNPRALLTRIAGALRPGGTIVIHEYFDYGTWRLTPRSPIFESFVASVMESWRATGGEPDIGLTIPVWIEELGLRTVSLRPIVDVITPASDIWQWPKTFIEVGLRRLVNLGRISQDRAQTILGDFAVAEATPRTMMVTPAVLEIIAQKR
ncbi:MAG TPA: methyltransferase domain-containing protein [Thermoanaerobaculia bacterium]|nr:methyltransferase domain-containing protein [Thermoanaerobaculia bacterium]